MPRAASAMVCSDRAAQNHELLSSLVRRFQLQNLDVLEPHFVSMVLEPDVAFSWKVRDGLLEFVTRTIGTFSGQGEFVAVQFGNGFSIDCNADIGALAFDRH